MSYVVWSSCVDGDGDNVRRPEEKVRGDCDRRMWRKGRGETVTRTKDITSRGFSLDVVHRRRAAMNAIVEA